jgi:hypothetical protein
MVIISFLKYISSQSFQDFCTPWKDVIVVKLLGNNLCYSTMKDRLLKVWKFQGGFEIVDNDNGFYMVKFDHNDDKEKVITGGPWLIFYHCRVVSHWSTESLHRMQRWNAQLSGFVFLA